MTDLTDDQVRALLTDEESVRVVAKEGKGCGPAMAVRLADALLQARADLRLQKSTITQMTMQWGEDAVRVEELIAELAQARADAAAAQALIIERAAENVRSVWGRCEALDDESADKLARSEELTDHEIGFWRGQKSVAKSIRRSTEMPTSASDAGTAELARLRGELDGAQHLRSTIPDNPDSWEQVESMAQMLDAMATREAARQIAEEQGK